MTDKNLRWKIGKIAEEIDKIESKKSDLLENIRCILEDHQEEVQMDFNFFHRLNNAAWYLGASLNKMPGDEIKLWINSDCP